MAITSAEVKGWLKNMDPAAAAKVIEQLEGQKSRSLNYSENPNSSSGGRARHTPGVMNDTEKAFAAYLGGLVYAGVVSSWEFESIKLRIGHKCWYTPDFFCDMVQGRCVAYEVKGFWEDDARVKIKAAAARYRWIKFVTVKKTKSGWEFEEIAGR